MKDLNILKYNRHWEKGLRYPFPKKREIFNTLLKCLQDRRIVQLTGLRRTGKTVLLQQIINHILGEVASPFSIWYFTFDEEQVNLDDLFQIFSRQTGLEHKKEKIYIFLDEVQKLQNFQNQLKVYYDQYPGPKFFISGSKSLLKEKPGEPGRQDNEFSSSTVEFQRIPAFQRKGRSPGKAPGFQGGDRKGV